MKSKYSINTNTLARQITASCINNKSYSANVVKIYKEFSRKFLKRLFDIIRDAEKKKLNSVCIVINDMSYPDIDREFMCAFATYLYYYLYTMGLDVPSRYEFNKGNKKIFWNYYLCINNI